MNRSDQNIIACVSDYQSGKEVVRTATFLSYGLGKGLIILHVCPPNANKEQATQWVSTLGNNYIVMQGSWKEVIDSFATLFNGILAVANVDKDAPKSSLSHPRTLLRQFRDCRIAYLTIQQGFYNSPKNVALTIDYRRESKEKLIWSSYFGRFMGSSISLISPKYHDEGLLEKKQNNVRFSEKMLSSLGVTFSYATLPQVSTWRNDIDMQACNHFLSIDLLIAMTTDTREKGLKDILFGTAEQHLIVNSNRVPILLLNTRDDLYVLCD